MAKCRMNDFVIQGRTGTLIAVFHFGIDFSEGERRLCWTASGLDKLIELGLWRREFDKRGNLKTKPIRVEAAMKLPQARVLAGRDA
jgi:hypothetical protein